MKNLLILAAAFILGCSTMNAQRSKSEYKEQIKQRKEMIKLTGKALDSKIDKYAKAEAKRLKKEGWKPLPGELPLEKQLDTRFRSEVMLDPSGKMPLYFIGNGEGMSFARQNAYTMASTNSKVDIAGLIETEVDQMIEQSQNDQQTNDEFNSMRKMVAEGTSYVQQKLNNLKPLVKMYKERGDKIEVQVIMAVESKIAKAAIFEKMEQENKELRDKLEDIIGK